MITQRMAWEPIDRTKNYDDKLWRARVPSGWLVRDRNGGITYVPDARHAWVPEREGAA